MRPAPLIGRAVTDEERGRGESSPPRRRRRRGSISRGYRARVDRAPACAVSADPKYISEPSKARDIARPRARAAGPAPAPRGAPRAPRPAPARRPPGRVRTYRLVEWP